MEYFEIIFFPINNQIIIVIKHAIFLFSIKLNIIE